MALQTPPKTPGATTGGAMAQALERAGATAQPAGSPPVAPNHPDKNVGEGRTPGMNPVPGVSASATPAQAQPYSFRRGGTQRSFISKNPGDEAVDRLSKALDKIVTETGHKDDFEYQLIPINRDDTSNLVVSVILMCLRDKLRPEIGVAYHTLIVEASSDPLLSVFLPIANENVEITRTMSDAYDDAMIAQIREVVQRRFPNTNTFDAEAEVVPRDFNVDDMLAVRKLAANAADACVSELNTRDPNFQDLNLVGIERDSTLTVRVNFNSGSPAAVEYDAVGEPMRADVTVDFSAVPMQQPNQSVQLNVERTRAVSHVSGFVDLLWMPLQGQPGPFNMPAQPAWGQPQQSLQRYVARYVITQLESQQQLTIAQQLLALVPAITLRENNMWVRALMPGRFNDPVQQAMARMHDIGAIGIEVNFADPRSGQPGVRVDTSEDTFKPDTLMGLVQQTFHPGMMLSLDIPECGPQTWYNAVFGAAAEGNQDAIAAILESANVLTNGNFQNYFPSGGRVTEIDDNRIHMGHYIGRDGRKHDIRDIDYLAVLNQLGEREPAMVRRWSDTFTQLDWPREVKLFRRKQIITALESSTVFTGWARRVTFSGEFLDAFIKAINDVGLALRPAQNYADLGTYERPTAAFMRGAIMSASPTGLYNRPQPNQPATMGGGAFARRW